jgi:hypothetical protein
VEQSLVVYDNREQEVEPPATQEGQGIMPELPAVRESPDALHDRLVVAAKDSIEMAVLAKLKVWESGDIGYTLDDMMRTARWLEGELEPPDTLPVIVYALGGKARASWRASGCAACVAVFALVFVLLVSLFGIEITEPASVAAPGFFHGGDNKVASAAEAVESHTLHDFPSLSIQDLRRVEDVTLIHQGELHLYRVASVSRLSNGRVRVTAEDGTLIQVGSDGHASLRRAYQAEEVVDMSSASGTLRTVAAYSGPDDA